jgi:hypothetical protein
VLNYIRNGREAVHTAQFTIDVFMSEPIAHGGTWFSGLESNTLYSQFVRHAGKRVRTLHVNARCGGEIEHH